MKTKFTLEELLEVNNNHYSGEIWFVTIKDKPYSFIKGYIFDRPKKFQHKNYISNNNQCAAYIVKHTPTGKVYIGSSNEIHRRIVYHKWAIERKQHSNGNFERLLQTATIQEFEIIIIFTQDRDEAYDVEQCLVDHYADGDLLLNIQKDVKELAVKGCTRLGSKATLGTRLRQRNSMLGKKPSDLARQRMSEFRKTDEKAIDQFSKILEAKRRRISVEGIEYESLTQAGKLSPYSESFIRRALKHNRNHKSNIFYLSDNASPLIGRNIPEEHKQRLSHFRKTNPAAIAQLESIRELARRKILLNGTLYESVSEAVRRTGIPESVIHKKLRLTNGKANSDCYVLNYVKPQPMKVLIDGRVHNSLTEASVELGINRSTLKNRLRWGKIQYVR